MRRRSRRRSPRPRPARPRGSPTAQPSPAPPAGRLVTKPEYEKLSAYYNLDNGTGRIRGVYMQGNEGVRNYFRRWLAPFADLGAQTLTLANTGSTDHVPFDQIGLPGFQFIQDAVEYNTRTHHSTQDTYERIQADDVKQAAVIMAAFVYQTAMLDERLPRKPAPGQVGARDFLEQPLKPSKDLRSGHRPVDSLKQAKPPIQRINGPMTR